MLSTLLKLAMQSAWNRRNTLILTLISILLSTALLLGIERLRQAARTSFNQSLAQTDLVVGAKTSPLQLMLYTVYRIGEPTANLSWTSAQKLAQDPKVAWSIPLSLGDSHHGYPVLGTTAAYFQHYHYGQSHSLVLAQGRAFEQIFDVVLGAEVARDLHYSLGQKITLSHGLDDSGLGEHADKPFTVVGILAPTHTPVDRTLHISLTAMEAIHVDWQGGAPLPGYHIAAADVQKFDLTPKTITALLIGLKNRSQVFRMQRQINAMPEEPLTAVLPGVALDSLWQITAKAEQAMLAISTLVALVSLIGLIAVLLASMATRRRELAILRSVGAGSGHILFLLLCEGGCISLLGITLGMMTLLALQPCLSLLSLHFLGVDLLWHWPSAYEWLWLGGLVLASLLASLFPAWRAWRMTLADGLSPRL